MNNQNDTAQVPQIRNPVYVDAKKTQITCEISDDGQNWHPYGAFDNSGEVEMQAIWDELQKRKAIAPYVAPTITADQVKDEAQRRILAVAPDWKQRNLSSRQAELLDKGRSNWTAAQSADWDAITAIWAQINAIRTASNQIEAMKPIPQNYQDDSRWPDHPST